MKVGMMIVRDRIAIVLPRVVSFIAWCACPFRRSSCPGSVPSAVSASGAPSRIDGMKSMKVCVIARDVMKVRRISIGTELFRVSVRISAVIMLMWSPGVSPVMVPVRMPVSRGMIKFNILFSIQNHRLRLCFRMEKSFV